MFTKFSSLIAAMAIMATPVIARAHVDLRPKTANVGESTTFTASVPNEKDLNVIQLKLLIPDSIKDATPTVKPGWTIQVDKAGEGESAFVTSITWSGGIIPADQRDDFTFQSQVPAKTTELNWKTYETYSDGSISSWDQAPTAIESENNSGGPYSTTKVVNDLKVAATSPAATSDGKLPLILSGIAILMSFGALLGFKKNS